MFTAAGSYNDRRGGANSDACRRCPSSQDSTNGSRVCTFCSAGYSRPTADSSASDCSPCDVIQGVACARNTTTATLNLTVGYWRHSDQTLQTWYCKHSGDWSPCLGGADAGHEGDGYCADGYHGPRCELCAGPDRSRYFDKLDATCHECGQIASQSAIVTGSLLFITIVVISAAALAQRNDSRSKVAVKMLRPIHKCQRRWRKAGMRFKLKAALGFYQCLAAIPIVYNVTVPSYLDHLTRCASACVT